ncbi:hypothetical protein PoB_000053600, partial [Plakobranchus ocellatus]
LPTLDRKMKVTTTLIFLVVFAAYASFMPSMTAHGYIPCSEDQTSGQVRDMLRDQARDMLRDQARDMARDQARDMARDQAREMARDQARDQANGF